MATGARWNSVRLEQKITRALATSRMLDSEYERVAQEVADETSDRIRQSGRGGSHNSEFANIQHRVFRSQANRMNVLVGWLNPAPGAQERGGGGKLWYQYQDAGFRLFGGDRWIDGVGATIDQRYRLLEGLTEANFRILRVIKNQLEA